MNDEKTTWDLLCKIEPRLLNLLAEVKSVKDDKTKPSFCANDVWYADIKPKLIRLVGWYAGGADYRLRSRGAYNLAIHVLYNELPDCRNCGCL